MRTKTTVRLLMIALALAAATLGAMSLLAPTASADPPAKRFCGGEPGGNGCPAGFDCVDFPGDKCDPLSGWLDCIGYCKKLRP